MTNFLKHVPSKTLNIEKEGKNLMAQALWKMNARAIKWFNYCYSLPKVWLPSLQILGGFMNVGNAEKPLVMTNSISEDYARVWLYFARQSLNPKEWDFLIVDSAGDMDPSRFKGSRMVKFLNIYHGKKMDLLLRKFITSDTIFLCDDDKYILNDVSQYFSYLQDPKTPVVSLSPRTWWKFKINGQEFLPMGSYSLIFQRRFFRRHGLRFQAPSTLKSELKIFAPGIKQQQSYDTADYANEQLLQMGYNVVTLQGNPSISGFDGLSGCRILLMKYCKAEICQTLSEARHYKVGSNNGGTVRSLYGIVKFERLYQDIFHTPPKFMSGFLEKELRQLVEKNRHITNEQRDQALAYFSHSDTLYQNLRETI